MIERGPIKFEIVRHFGVLSTAPTGWTKEFNIVRWNDREKFDIRDWAPGHERMSKGVTLYEYEMKKIFEMCTEIFSEVQPETSGELSETSGKQNEIEQQGVQGTQAVQVTPTDQVASMEQVTPINQITQVAEEEIPF